MTTRPIYLDYHATTPTDPRVAAVAMHYMTEAYGNASSVDHLFGDEAHHAVEAARREIALLAGTSPRSVVFTSGSTEAINLALQGLARAQPSDARVLRIGLSATEHRAVLDTCTQLERSGVARLCWLRVDDRGRLDLDHFEHVCRTGLDLACVMAANNEIGTVTPMDLVGEIAAAEGVSVLCDATQAAGKIPIRRDDWSLTYTTLSAHKLYGPKGVGALILPPNSPICSLLHGGGQERGLRPGTLNVPGIAAFGEACRLRRFEMSDDERRIGQQRDRLQDLLRAAIPELCVNGDLNSRLAGSLHISIPGVPNTAVVARVREHVALSTGAACASGAIGPSHVLRAVNLSEAAMDSAVRIGLGKFTTDDDVETAGNFIAEAVARIKGLLHHRPLSGAGQRAMSLD